MAKRKPLVVPIPDDNLPLDYLIRRVRMLDWAYKRLNLLDEYIALGVTEAAETLRAYRVCRRDYGDIQALEALEVAIAALEAAV